ncbi:PD-(D/E)XK nuclease family protein [Umezakia ovalisporum]|uniref:PD-(D/E)XK nuclease family protein n=2 Tax=Umezakia ovalisporum TaxID=75695 RepID=A0AA43GV81_9CYAN|nr:PD-(D/E)XK nuclease family protein [Umezakia ovalisporum]MDH6057332.1 PD-(D/E)XK nuclease family protein [Umezakia ovalisporum FSS-43]MDH6062408.1 PD-(D/E)XK nuclease family protein [Umezakia ovalisporum FSS-62]MDH6069156.1 PD-(D/E)XK nuclease family protein [Umezakia ovalisporum APH033B]MDH6072754.1 PD-(D/E)XK nuclease family protein [Umezakia ovalisporum CobakiLakeA]MDH6075593.1 PD-(D/E)XK nuclease family protein [Umezakia ovalisporum CS-1034]
MSFPNRPFASYHLWSLVAPATGQERWHCQMRRGFIKARQHEPQVKALLGRATAPQLIGILAQKGVYEFHHNRHLLNQSDGVDRVAQLLKLSTSTEQVQQRVLRILQKYHNAPLLLNKHIIQLTRGDEGFPKPIFVEQKDCHFRLYAAMDCIFWESDRTLHILDFKTGKSSFDRRQALVYLLAARYLYPGIEAVASFYNLEMCKESDLISINNGELESLKFDLANIANKHQYDLQKYHEKTSNFSKIFPPNPGNHCRFCQFNSICDFSKKTSYFPTLPSFISHEGQRSKRENKNI